jgi:hypothetical protein
MPQKQFDSAKLFCLSSFLIHIAVLRKRRAVLLNPHPNVKPIQDVLGARM